MSKPEIAEPFPAEFEVEAGRRYAWCACGRSNKQPFCDGSHEVTDLKPVVFTAERTETVWLCQCKQTGDAPFCDGSHENLGKIRPDTA